MTKPSPKTLYLKPARPGLVVRDPVSRRPLPAEGIEVPDTPHWRRQMRFGDAVEVPSPVAKAPPKSSGPNSKRES